ncbi:MAG TPA: thiamine pyrophosphate-dependent enzyme [Methanocella sp.]|nr:thiamine pyrophosphate-dependent enzyme [Methanocella sp.]
MAPVSLTGAEAVRAAAEDAAVRMATGVPGFPINEVFTGLQSMGIAGWQFNEKIAFEMALGASVCGDRAMVVSKHVGINIMADPMIISATMGIGEGIVVIAGDDVGAAFSQNEQDSRWYGKLGEIPVLDPSSPGDLYDAVADGLVLSGQISAPVLVRVTGPVLEMAGPVNRRVIQGPGKAPDRHIWDYTMLGKHQKYLRDGWTVASHRALSSPTNRITRKGRIGIISSGGTSVLAREAADAMRLSHLSLGFINPFPKRKVEEFVNEMEAVLVCEEPSPYIESHLSTPKVRGRFTGHLPTAGPLDVQKIMDAVEHILETKMIAPVEPETMESRDYYRTVCEGCPFAPVYWAIKSLDTKVASDVGCSILTSNPPYSMVDVACSLGSPVSVASGFREKGIAMLGDFGLMHTGMQALLSAKYRNKDVLVVLFVNRKAAMTGGQELPDVTDLVVTMFGEQCKVVEAAGITAEIAKKELSTMLQRPGLNIYLVRGDCPEGATHGTKSP